MYAQDLGIGHHGAPVHACLSHHLSWLTRCCGFAPWRSAYFSLPQSVTVADC